MESEVGAVVVRSEVVSVAFRSEVLAVIVGSEVVVVTVGGAGKGRSKLNVNPHPQRSTQCRVSCSYSFHTCVLMFIT